jgi:hypothetical protein
VNLIRWFTSPNIPPTVNKRNFLNVQIDAIGIGLAGAASPFLPVFLTRLAATPFQISLLTAMPAITGLILSIPVGNFLQSRRQIVPWFSAARLMVVLCYALTGIAAFLLPREQVTIAVLAIWAMATLPQTVVAIGFSVVMNAVAGPTGRYELMTRRWSILGFTTAISVIGAGQILDHLGFPFNYQLVFMALSLGGLISYYFSSHIKLPDAEVQLASKGKPIFEKIKEYAGMVRREKAFVSFTAKRFIFLTGTALAAPIFPLYYVRQIHATDAWIAVISTAQSAVLIFGYFFWSRQSRRKGNRTVLIWTTLGLSLHPLLVALTGQVWLIAVFAGLSGIFQAGLDLVFFDELMQTFPAEYSATFVSIAQGLQYMSSILAPLIGSYLAGQIGLSGALIISATIRLIGFLAFAVNFRRAAPNLDPVEE